MPRPRTHEPAVADEQLEGAGNGSPEIGAEPERARKRRRWPTLRRRRTESSTQPGANGQVEIPAVEIEGSDESLLDSTNKTKAVPAILRRLTSLPKKMFPSKRPKKPKKRRQTKTGVAIKWTLVLLFVILLVGTVRSFRNSNAIVKERSARTAEDARVEGQLKQLGASSIFPLEDAVAKARRLAYECFSVPNAGVTSDTEDFLALQNKALADAGIPVGDKVSCGWDGKGRGKVDDMQVVNDPYWIRADRATIVLQVKLYQRPGFIYFYTPFRSSNGVAQYAGMPAIFGTASGAEDFITVCGDPDDSTDTEKLQRTAQLFVSALAGEGDLDIGYLTYEGAKFGSFSPTVSSPKVTQVKYCGANGSERLFAATVQFSGPIRGSHYTLPYAFSVVPNPQTSGRYQVKHFGPAPGYTGA